MMFGRWRKRRTPWAEEVLWSLDLEARGLDMRRDHILSVGMVPVRQARIRYGESWYQLVRPPQDHVPQPEALRVHHILPEEAATAPSLREVLLEIFSRLGSYRLLLHHSRLDLGLLKQAFGQVGLRWPRPEVVDTVDLLTRMNRRRRLLEPHAEPYSTALAEPRAELGLPPHRAHHALSDAVATAELYLALQHRLEG